MASSEHESRAISDASDLSHPILRKLFIYWDGKRGQQAYPRRADVDPIEIPMLLPYVILVDAVADSADFIFRVAGTMVTEASGMELTGKRLRLLPLSPIGTIVAEFSQVIESAEPRYSAGPLTNPLDQYDRVERLLLPLTKTGEKVEQILGGVVFHSASNRSF